MKHGNVFPWNKGYVSEDVLKNLEGEGYQKSNSIHRWKCS
ncbi:hypothetical protein VP193E371_P0097 [Vibrio phage 193E37-1]|nr:hypothetical protein VP193E371_P0097 [Vibrio phage 193E37-1]